MKTSDLIGQALDYAVAKAQGWKPNFPVEILSPQYSTDWAQGGEILEREKISTEENGQGFWNARIYQQYRTTGPTPLIAAMRCFVSSRLGDEVDVPEELL